MKVQNIIIDDNEIIIVNSNGGQHKIPTTNLQPSHRTWVDNIKACAVSLMAEYKADDFELQDWQNTLLDGMDDLDGLETFWADEL